MTKTPSLLLAGLLMPLGLTAQAILGGGGGGGGGTVANITDDLVHRWAMEPGTCSGDATSVTDDGSASENLTCTNTPQWTATAAVGSCAIDFTKASSEHCETATSPTIPTGDNFTWAMWVKPDAVDSCPFVVMDGSGGNELQLLLDASASLNTAFNNVTLSDLAHGAWVAGHWMHLALVREATLLKIYLNGHHYFSRPVTGAALDFSTCQILIGVDADATCNGTLGNYFDGQMDDVRVYSRSLTETDIQALYALGN